MTELRIDAMTFCRDFKDSGGTLALWHEIGAAVFANEMAEKGRGSIDIPTRNADLCQPNPQPGGQGHVGFRPGIASSAGEPVASEEAILRMDTKGPVPPAREPNESYRAALARDRIRNNAIWLSTHKTSTGKWWVDVSPFELDGMERDGVVAKVIRKVYGPFSQKQMHMTLGQLITPHIEKKLVRELERLNAA